MASLAKPFKGQNITTCVIDNKGKKIPKINTPYNFLSAEKREKVNDAIAQAKETGANNGYI